MNEQAQVVVTGAGVSESGNAWLHVGILEGGVVRPWDSMAVNPQVVEGFRKALAAAGGR